MKKLFTTILTYTFLANILLAQNFSLEPKTGKSQASAIKNTISVDIKFTNNAKDSTDINFDYEVIEVSIPSNWGLSICDPFACLEGSGVKGFKSNFEMRAGKNGNFKLDFEPKGNSGAGMAKVAIKSKKTGFVDTLAGEAKAWGVSVRESAPKTSKELIYFPNPAKEELSLKYYSKESFQVDIYNILGSKVKSFNLFGGQATVNIEDLENGIYFLRFKDDGKTISKTFTKN